MISSSFVGILALVDPWHVNANSSFFLLYCTDFIIYALYM